MGDLKDAVAAAIRAERKRVQPRLKWLRLGSAGAYLVGILALRLAGERYGGVDLGWCLAYVASALVLGIAAERSDRIFSWMPFANMAVDLPISFLICRELLAVAEEDARMIPLVYLIVVISSVVSGGLWMARLPVWGNALVGAAIGVELIREAGLHGFFWPILMVGTAIWFALYAVAMIGRSERLAMYFAREQKETSTLNEELKRQISDRAGQLASAIARLSPAPRALEAGSLIEGRYRVLRELGKGGMGAVYEVERISDGKHLALKVLTGVADRDALARFAREAQIAAQLHHPSIVSILDVDVAKSGMLFLVMELAGSSLEKQRGKFGDRGWAMPILKQIAEGLSVMHARGIVHRDLKPANVLLDGEIAKLADFGIASLLPAGDDSTISVGLTKSGAFMGTPLYMAPELERGAGAATPSSDVFALGIVAYELLSGRAPFAQPPVLAKTQGKPQILDGEIGALVDRCLNFDPSLRPSAGELARSI